MTIQKVSFSIETNRWIPELKRVLGNEYLLDRQIKDEAIINNYHKMDPRPFFKIEIDGDNTTPEECIIKGIRALANFYQADNFLKYAAALEENDLLLAETCFHVHERSIEMLWICGHEHGNGNDY